jgi:hypothetical protein
VFFADIWDISVLCRYLGHPFREDQRGSTTSGYISLASQWFSLAHFPSSESLWDRVPPPRLTGEVGSLISSLPRLTVLAVSCDTLELQVTVQQGSYAGIPAENLFCLLWLLGRLLGRPFLLLGRLLGRLSLLLGRLP